MDNRARSLLPVTVISGFLGSGKTTLMNYILSLRHKNRVAILVNDMGEVNVDAELIASGAVRKTREKLVELHNGCICCTLRFFHPF
jgi:G3E family GTPase